MLGVTVSAERADSLVVTMGPNCIHGDIGCLGCHPAAEQVPHPANLLALTGNPCIACHEDVVKVLNRSAHKDPAGGTDFPVQCWDCHGAHVCYKVSNQSSPVAPAHVAQRCLQCHDKRSYLAGVHGQAVQLAGLNVAATCVSCHGAHDILAPSQAGSRVARRNVSFTCGNCHGSVAETYRNSVHGAALTEHDNPDVPTCVDCHEAHATRDPRSPLFRSSSPQLCGKCHADKAMMTKYGISTEVFQTYVTDFHGTTAELFRELTPNQPLNQAVCYDCHGFHNVVKVTGEGKAEIEENLLQRCKRCHPTATTRFLSAWTDHYVPSPTHYPIIYYVRLFYRIVIPATIGFFLLYIVIDAWARRRHRGGKV